MKKTSSPFASFDKELVRAGRLFVRTWKPAVVISLFPVVPLLFLLPLLIEMNTVIVEEYFTRSADISSVSLYTAVFAVIATFLVWMFVRCSLFILFSQGGGGKKALKTAVQRYLPFLWTEIFIMIIVSALSVPAFLFSVWSRELGWASLVSTRGDIGANLLAYVTFAALLAPAVVVSMWFLFAPVGVALGKTRSGMRALRHSVHIVQGKWWSIFLRMVALTVIVFVTRIILSPLPFASWIASFLLSLLLAAFLVVLHREAQGKRT